MTLTDKQVRLWHALGLGPIWRDQAGLLSSDSALVRNPSEPGLEAATQADGTQSTTVKLTQLNWDQLREQVASCQACGLCHTRKQTVFSAGSAHAPWLFVGEAPGADEDEQGEPFVGQAGRLLDQILLAMGLSRQIAGANNLTPVCIANVLKCRPPRNRDPEPAEVAQCLPFLQRQIELLNPQIIVVLGRFAAQAVLNTDATIASLRGKVQAIQVKDRRVPVIVTYHPAYLLRTPADKAKTWDDLCLALDTFQAKT